MFLGAAPDAWDQGRAYGIPAANVAQYDPDRYRDLFACTARGTNVLASSLAPRSENLFASVSKAILEKAGLRQASERARTKERTSVEAFNGGTRVLGAAASTAEATFSSRRSAHLSPALQRWAGTEENP